MYCILYIYILHMEYIVHMLYCIIISPAFLQFEIQIIDFEYSYCTITK